MIFKQKFTKEITKNFSLWQGWKDGIVVKSVRFKPKTKLFYIFINSLESLEQLNVFQPISGQRVPKNVKLGSAGEHFGGR